jgi:signal transduction histidine kinase
MERDHPIPNLLAREREPVTLRYLESECRDGRENEIPIIQTALEEMERAGFKLLVPLHHGEELAGWIGMGGELLSRHLNAETAAALLAIGNQALACLERIEAMENTKRQEAMAAVGRMAAGLAHEIRNPLGAIRGASQVLADETDAQRAGEMRAVIEEETERLGRVVGEFLEYAKPGTPARQNVEPGALIERVLRSAEAAGRGMRFEVHIDEGTGRIRGDEDQLQRALANLVDNARDAAGADGRLRITVSQRGDGNTVIVLDDNGPGISDKEAGRLFTPFHTTKPGGTGLGLALVHRVVEAHGGTIEVEGRPGRGALFTLVLPAAGEAAA